MSMQAASLEVLEKANLPAPQARAIVQAIEIEIAGARDTLATKQDTLLLRQDMAELGHDLRKEMSNWGMTCGKRCPNWDMTCGRRCWTCAMDWSSKSRVCAARSMRVPAASRARCTGRSSGRWRCSWGLPIFSWHTSGVELSRA